MSIFVYFSLHRHLVEHLNAEIVLHTINDMSIAMEWIRYTFLYIRVMKNPKHYGKFYINTAYSRKCIRGHNEPQNALQKLTVIKLL